MPIYEYTCRSCEHDFEQLVRLSDPIPPCPECESEEVTKRVSAAGFVLKGSGWYRDHYGLKSDDSGKKSKKSDKKKSKKKKDAKPASKSSAKKAD